jgi:aspartyl-tRNA(Asn)/glutamyl-tRNA(Gln) amidotransferase subunit B
MKTYETVIGLEVHIQLNTKSKAFCADLNQFNLEPNQHISAVTLALPGTLPVANKVHLEKAVKLALALESSINEFCFFDRKNYFYPDLPKGYQITQDKEPFCRGGVIKFKSEGKECSIRIHHIHMEEDAGKSTHDLSEVYSLLDYNRAGTPLLELVTEPDFRSGQQVHDFLAHIQKLVQYLDISDGNMEEGSIRCDCNVSIRELGAPEYGERREVKNVNSKKFARAAVEVEAKSQIALIEAGETIHKTTMLFDPETNTTRAMRKKETENDYRYFPEPDLAPIHITKELLERVKNSIDYMPETLELELANDFEVPFHHLDVLTEYKEYGVDYIVIAKQVENKKELSDLYVLKLLPEAKSKEVLPSSLITIKSINDLTDMISSNQISKSAAYQNLLPLLIEDQKKDVKTLANELGLIREENQDFLDEVISKVLANNQAKVKEYQSGKKGLIGFFMGQVVREAGNKVDPKVLNDKLVVALKG